MPDLTDSTHCRSNRSHPLKGLPRNCDQYVAHSQRSTTPSIHIVQIPASILVYTKEENFQAVVQKLTGRKHKIQEERERRKAKHKRNLKLKKAPSETERQKRSSAQESLNQVATSVGEPVDRRHSNCDTAASPAGFLSILEREPVNPFSLWESMPPPALIDILALDQNTDLHNQPPLVDHDIDNSLPPVLWDWPDL